MPENDKLLQSLERLERLLTGVQKVYEKIPIPEAYRGIVVSWLSLEVVVFGIVSSFPGPGEAARSPWFTIPGLGEAAGSPWFTIPTAILTILHGLALVGAYRTARKRVQPAVAGSQTCRVATCRKKPTMLGFCPAHAARARGCYRLLENYNEGDSEYFFGREEAIAEVLRAVEEHALTLLVGESGVGKSSLLRAGVNHNLAGQGKRGFKPVYINCRDVGGRPGRRLPAEARRGRSVGARPRRTRPVRADFRPLQRPGSERGGLDQGPTRRGVPRPDLAEA